MKTCQWLYMVEPGQEEVWGHEAVALAEIARSGVPVLPAFVVAREAIAAYFVQPGLKKAILHTAKSVPADRPELFAGLAKEIRRLILKTPFPTAFQESCDSFFQKLEEQVLLKPGSGLRITVSELSPHGTSLTDTITTVEQGEQLLRKLLALSFTEHLLHERARRQSILGRTYPIMIQYHEEAGIAGTAVVHDQERHDDSTITIEAHHHEHGKAPALATVDRYRVDRKTLLLLSRQLGDHQWASKKNGKHHSAPRKGSGLAVLSDSQIRMLAKLVKRAQSLFTDVYRFEWLYAHNQLFITRLERITQEIEAAQRGDEVPLPVNGPMPVLMGLPGNLGTAVGPVKVVKQKTTLKGGEIVVVEQLKPGDHLWLAGAGALIAETGHHASFEAQMAKQLGIPAVIAAGSAVPHFKDGQIVTVDGTHGAVYAGNVPVPEDPSFRSTLPATGTKILATVLDPTQVKPEELAHADGIGLLRSEFILRTLGVHPEDIIRKKLHHEYVEILAEGIEEAVRAVYPKPVVYQLHDMHTAHLLGWRQRHQDRHEPNPTIGYRGTHRLLKEPELLDMELQALSTVMARGLHTVEVMLPMVRSLEEVEEMYRRLKASPLAKHAEVALWVKCETPALAIRAEELCELPIRGVCFDVPALSELIVGMDKENYQVSHHLDRADDAVLQALEYAIATCRLNGIRTTICAEMEGLKAETVAAAVQSGVTGICVAPSDIEPMHGLVASVEQRMLLDHILDEVPRPE